MSPCEILLLFQPILLIILINIYTVRQGFLIQVFCSLNKNVSRAFKPVCLTLSKTFGRCHEMYYPKWNGTYLRYHFFLLFGSCFIYMLCIGICKACVTEVWQYKKCNISKSSVIKQFFSFIQIDDFRCISLVMSTHFS